MVANASEEERQPDGHDPREAEKLFVGKTIIGIDTEAINAWRFDLSDGTEVLIENVDFHIHPGLHRLVCREVRE